MGVIAQAVIVTALVIQKLFPKNRHTKKVKSPKFRRFYLFITEEFTKNQK